MKEKLTKEEINQIRLEEQERLKVQQEEQQKIAEQQANNPLNWIIMAILGGVIMFSLITFMRA